MARDQNALRAKINPIIWKVRKVDAPILGFLLDVSFEAEAVCPRRCACEITLVICAFVFIGNATVDREKRREKGGGTDSRNIRGIRDRNRRGRNRRSHLRERNQSRSAVVKQNLI